MLLIRKVDQLRAVINNAKKEGHLIGLVPTMGALHDGHRSLLKECKKESSFSIASIFVNPTQFNNQEDLDNYPRNEDEDCKMLKEEGFDAAFIPDAQEVYHQKPTMGFQLGGYAQQLEGKFRPGHFEGVALVVCKLFNMVTPDLAFFGRKDLQQLSLIQTLNEQLSFGIKIIGVETERNDQGLALSSRNKRLSGKGAVIATDIYKGLQIGRNALESEGNLNVANGSMKNHFDQNANIDVEYCEIIDPKTFLPVQSLDQRHEVAICIAAYIEGIRLIDNVYLRLD